MADGREARQVPDVLDIHLPAVDREAPRMQRPAIMSWAVASCSRSEGLRVRSARKRTCRQAVVDRLRSRATRVGSVGAIVSSMPWRGRWPMLTPGERRAARSGRRVPCRGRRTLRARQAQGLESAAHADFTAGRLGPFTKNLPRCRATGEPSMSAVPSPMPKPLDGILVVALEQAVAAPYCIEPAGRRRRAGDQDRAPEGDFARGYDGAVLRRIVVLRVDQPGQGIDRAGRQARRRPCVADVA
jgi:hypothetical protein